MGPTKKEKRETMLMPIGKYAGNDIDTIPDYYLTWVAENWDEDSAFKKRIVEACDGEMRWRRTNGIFISEDDFQGEKVQ